MQVGNRQELDSAREALRDQFDAIWMQSDSIGRKEERAIRCALALDYPRLHHNSLNWTITKGGRHYGPHNSVIYS